MVYILPGPQIRSGMASMCVFFGLATLSHAYGELNLLIQLYDPFDFKEKIQKAKLYQHALMCETKCNPYN